jgi:hypothetical protein
MSEISEPNKAKTTLTLRSLLNVRTPIVLGVWLVVMCLVWASTWEISGDADEVGFERFHRKYYGLPPYFTIVYLPVQARRLNVGSLVCCILVTLASGAAAVLAISKRRYKYSKDSA